LPVVGILTVIAGLPFTVLAVGYVQYNCWPCRSKMATATEMWFKWANGLINSKVTLQL